MLAFLGVNRKRAGDGEVTAVRVVRVVHVALLAW